MKQPFSLGLAKIHAEAGEVRAFLPNFVHKMAKLFKQIILEEGYGAEMGFSHSDYTKPLNVTFAAPQTVYAQDFVLVLRYPPDDFLRWMQQGACLISMCHFPTRPERVRFLMEQGLHAFSLDSIVDDNRQRLVENLHAVAWNGCEVAFKLLDNLLPEPGLADPNRAPVRVTLLGSGGVGIHAVQAAIRYGDANLWQTYAKDRIPGNIVTVIDFDLTSHRDEIKPILKTTDLLIDATQRKNPSEIIVPNEFLILMPQNAVILDLSVDPYDFRHRPYEVKGIEGIPQGNLDQYIFPPDDPAWEEVPKEINTEYRRWVVSCYSWPGIHPKTCMKRYGNQISPLLRRLIQAGGVEKVNPEGRFHERALSRAMLHRWVQNEGN